MSMIRSYRFSDFITFRCDSSQTGLEQLTSIYGHDGLGSETKKTISFANNSPSYHLGKPLVRVSERFHIGENVIQVDFLKGFVKWSAWILDFESNDTTIHYSFPFFFSRKEKEYLLFQFFILPFLRQILAANGVFLFFQDLACVSSAYFVNRKEGKLIVHPPSANSYFHEKSAHQLISQEKLQCLEAEDIEEAPFRFFIQHDQIFGSILWEHLWSSYKIFLRKDAAKRSPKE